MGRWAIFTVLLFGGGCVAKPPPAPTVPAPIECVVLVHGLGRSSASLEGLARRLRGENLVVVNYEYASTRASVAEHAAELARRLPELVPADATKVHFVTHSLGGIVVRQLLKEHAVARLGRVVMLAPPNGGSELADALREVGLVDGLGLLGPAAAELGTRDGDLPRSLGPVAFECGIIAGDRTLNPIGGVVFSGPNDGKVSVEATKVDGMTDFLLVHHTHTFLMNADDVQRQVVRFLRTGRFEHEAAPSPESTTRPRG